MLCLSDCRCKLCTIQILMVPRLIFVTLIFLSVFQSIELALFDRQVLCVIFSEKGGRLRRDSTSV